MRLLCSAVAIFAIAIGSHGIARAEDAPGGGPKDEKIGFEPSEKLMFGSQHYFSSDTSLYAGLPEGFYGSFALSVYKSDISSRTATLYFTGGKDWNLASAFATLAVTPKSNNYSATSFDFGGSARTPIRDFRTTAGLDVNVTAHTETIPGLKPKTGHDVHIGQTTPTLSLTQRVFNTKAALYLSKSHYSADIQKLSDRLGPVSARFNGLQGLLQGFPDTTVKAGLYQDMPILPVTVWGTLTHTKLLVSNNNQTGVADDAAAGVDMDPIPLVSGTLEYHYFRQTGEPKAHYIGLTGTLHI